MLIFITTNLFFMFFLIYKNSRIIELTYKKQKNEKKRDSLLKNRDLLKRELCMIQNHASIKEYAINELKMQKVHLKDIRTLLRTTS